MIHGPRPHRACRALGRCGRCRLSAAARPAARRRCARSSLPTCASTCAAPRQCRTEGLSALAFAVVDMRQGAAAAAAARAARHAAESADRRFAHRAGGDAWRRISRSCARSRCRARLGLRRWSRAPRRPSAVASLDHVVIRSPNPERAVALYAGRLGLSLRLDRTRAGVGCAPPLLPLRRSHRRGRARPQGRDRRRARSAVGPVLARARHRQGARAAARQPASTSPTSASAAVRAPRSSR